MFPAIHEFSAERRFSGTGSRSLKKKVQQDVGMTFALSRIPEPPRSSQRPIRPGRLRIHAESATQIPTVCNPFQAADRPSHGRERGLPAPGRSFPGTCPGRRILGSSTGAHEGRVAGVSANTWMPAAAGLVRGRAGKALSNHWGHGNEMDCDRAPRGCGVGVTAALHVRSGVWLGH